MADVAIEVKNLSKSFRLPHERYTGLKQAVMNFRPGHLSYETQYVLEDVSFVIPKGEFFGIVGRNGSGKSTLLKLLAQIYVPDSGSVQINGSLTPFIELGVGFNPELTGRENVFMNGALLGFDRRQVNEMYDDVVDFAELKPFMDQKLKNYSSGMQVRLAFSISIRAKSDILLVDEVLAVGDSAFQTKCFDYFYELKKRGTTVVFISHDRSALERFCDSGILVQNGRVIERGPIRTVLDRYNLVVLENTQTENTDEAGKASTDTKYATIGKITTFGDDKKPSRKFEAGDHISVAVDIKIHQSLDDPIIGLTLWQKNVSVPVYATNTMIEDRTKTGHFTAGESIHFEVKLPPSLNNGEYFLEPAIANSLGTMFYDNKTRAHSFLIAGSNNPYSLLNAPGISELETVEQGDE